MKTDETPNLSPREPTRRLVPSSPGLVTRPALSSLRLVLFPALLIAAATFVARAQVFAAQTQATQSVAASARTTEAHVSVVSLSPPRVRVEGRVAARARAWSFRNVYAGVLGLAARIENFSLADAQGAEVAAHRLAPGEFEAAREATAFRYEVKLDPPATAGHAAHASWLGDTRGLLMPGDLLPLPLGRARLRLTLPPGWQTATLALPVGDSFETDDADSAVFLVGRDVRTVRVAGKGAGLALAIAGDWAFTDEEAAESVAPILKEHARSLGVDPPSRSALFLLPFPRASAPHHWSAETRGATVVLLSGRAPAKQSALARLSAPLTHELFHLWVPNALGLEGDYDWFYEGFTVYQSLRAGVRLGDLTFADFLDAIARSNDAYLRAAPGDTRSLVEASSRRWGDASGLVYHKGALAAFLYDLDVRQRTNGRRSLEDAYRALFRRAQERGPRAGNDAAIEALASAAGDAEFAERYIRAPRRIELREELSPYGLSVEVSGGRTRIGVAEKLTGRQRALLKQIGYN